MDQGVVHAGVLNMARMWETPARTLGGRWTRCDDAWATDSTLPTRLLNRVTVIRPLASSAAAGHLARRVADFYASRPDGGEFLVDDPWATLDLEPYAFRRWWSLPLMIRPQQESPRRLADLEVREARSRAELATFVGVLAQGFGLPVLESVPSSRVLELACFG